MIELAAILKLLLTVVNRFLAHFAIFLCSPGSGAAMTLYLQTLALKRRLQSNSKRNQGYGPHHWKLSMTYQTFLKIQIILIGLGLTMT